MKSPPHRDTKIDKRVNTLERDLEIDKESKRNKLECKKEKEKTV